jgi:tRNA dimethylallyltransferase
MTWDFSSFSWINDSKVVVVIGPTGIGKSQFAIDLVRYQGGEIVSADAIQVYRNMDIGSGKVSKEILAEIPHHLIDIRDPDDAYSMGHFLSDVDPLIERAHGSDGNRLVVCGGTGLYIYSLLHRFQPPSEAPDMALRQVLRQELETFGSGYLWERLNVLDPDTASEIHPNHSSRIVRALELVQNHGPIAKNRSRDTQQRSDCTVVGITATKEIIWDRIRRRVDQMVDDGLVAEVEGLLASGYSADLPALQALGYKETVEYLNGTLPDLDALKYAIFCHTRQFAKRQMTWFKRITNVHWIELV